MTPDTSLTSISKKARRLWHGHATTGGMREAHSRQPAHVARRPLANMDNTHRAPATSTTNFDDPRGQLSGTPACDLAERAARL